MIRDPYSRKKKEYPSLAVIGGGASGLFAAITAAEAIRASGRQARIRVYDANHEPAKKILVSGNGRCNLTNQTLRAEMYPDCSQALLHAVFKQFSNNDLLAFFRDRGLFTRADAAGRIYPRSNQAAAVRDFLLYLCERAGIVIESDSRIVSLKRENGVFLLNGRETADCVILACGSPAAPRNGGTDSLPLVSGLGVRILPFSPALTTLCVSGFSKNQLKGLRAEGTITVYSGDRVLAQDRGEIQYADYGLSGIPAMQVSGAAGKALRVGGNVCAGVDSLPEIPESALSEMLCAAVLQKGETPVLVFLNGLFPKRLSSFFMKRCGIAQNASLAALSPKTQSELCAVIKRLRLEISAVGGFADAQAAVGGVPAAELEPETLALKKCRGCFVCGEMADVVGACGGYNLQWAWSSGYVAGTNAAREILL